MKHYRIEGDTFRLECWGNGLSYNLLHKPSGLEVFTQGDDASRFEDELAAAELAWPDNTAEQNHAYLWDMYSEVATSAFELLP